MSTAVAADPGPDAPPGPRPGGGRLPRWLTRRLVVAVLAVVALLAGIVALAPGPRSDRPSAPDNPGPDGARAAAQILGREGVRVHDVRRLADALRLAEPGATLLVGNLGAVPQDRRGDLMATGADVVVLGSAFLPLDGLVDVVEPTPSGSTQPLRAQCADPDAAAASRVSGTTGSVRATGPGVEVCFPVGDGAGAYAAWEADGRTVRYLADPTLMSNDKLAEEGNAALVLRTLGHHRDLVWYLAEPDDPTLADDAAAGSPMVPGAVTGILLTLLAATAVLALARGRALGRVVTEVMPVVVRSSETTLGRGRLYRRSGAHDHAAAALRAGTATRTARHLALPRSAPGEDVAAAVARATGRDPAAVAALLHGPPPADDAALLRLSHELDALESEVHRT